MARVLLIDDSEITLAVVGDALRGAGHEVFTLDTALGAARAMKESQPQLVLLDLEMPALSGEKAAQLLLRRKPEGCRLVLFSAKTEQELREAVERSGADGFIKKTDNQAELLAAVAKHCQAA